MSDFIDGASVKMGGKEYTIPPLTFRHIQKLEPLINSIGQIQGTPTEKQMDAVAEIVHMAMSRNYPEMKREDVLDLLDLGNLKSVLDAVMGISGLVNKAGE